MNSNFAKDCGTKKTAVTIFRNPIIARNPIISREETTSGKAKEISVYDFEEINFYEDKEATTCFIGF